MTEVDYLKCMSDHCVTKITMKLEICPETGYVHVNQSHALVTPLRYRSKQPGIGLRNTRTFDPAYALFKIVDVMLKEYRAAVLADPGPIFFTADGSAAVKAPVQLWASEIRGPAGAG
jgi:hypothetical protein